MTETVSWVWEAMLDVGASWGGSGVWKAVSEPLANSRVWEAYVRPLVVWGLVLVFVCLLLMATVGRRLRLRKKYVEFLDRVFNFAAYTLGDEVAKVEEDEQDGQEGKVSDNSEDDSVVICPMSPRAVPSSTQDSFSLHDPLPYLAAGMRAVVQDCVTKSFTSAELRTWNMLSRTRRQRHLYVRPSLTVFWACGFVVRWMFLLPVRMLLLVVSLSTLIVLCCAVGLLPNSDFKRRLNARVVCWCFDFVAGSLSIVARFHNPENRPIHGITVVNHTSPIDSMVLLIDQCYDMVGQKANGILGVFMLALARSSSHIWFDRSEAKERSRVTRMIQEHAQDLSKPPIVIFPEGICLNNTAVMQFKKGAFEIDSVIHPVAIRFDLRYGDPFWWQNTFGAYIFSMMTSWAIVCDIWYLPPTRRKPNESPVSFANRVRALIAHRGGFEELAWDGFVKIAGKNNETWKQKEHQWRDKQQVEFARRFSRNEEKEQE